MGVLNILKDWWNDPNNAFYVWFISIVLMLIGVLPFLWAVVLGVWNFIYENKDRPNSARDTHVDPKGKYKGKDEYQLYYAKLKIKAVGFDGQKKALKEFLKINGQFQWCLVKGKGGTGKSKLCYDFMRSQERKWWKPWGWEPCMPVGTAKSFTKDRLDKSIKHLPRRTLFILDYAEYNTKVIRDWMKLLPDGKYRKKKIRVILIQRRESTSQEFRELCRDPYRFSKSPISLDDALGDSSMRELIRKYISKYKKKVTQSPDDIYNNLLAWDEEKKSYVRPLYALMLVDALADQHKDPLARKKGISHAKDMLEYIFNHEKATIENSLADNGYLKDRDIDTALILNAIATMIGSIPVEDTCLDLRRRLPKPKTTKDKDFSEISIFEGGNCEPIEPDIIGEYFVLKCTTEVKDFSKYIAYAWKHDANQYMRGFMTRLMQECDTSGSVFDPSKLENFSTVEIKEGETEIAAQSFQSHTYIRKLIIPASVKHIKFEAFNDCAKLEKVVFAGNSQLELIGPAAFYGCGNLKTINLPNTLITIGAHAFEKCPLDSGVIVPLSIKNAGKFAFFRCAVTFPDTFDKDLKAKLLGGETLEFGGLIWDILDERIYNERRQKLIITHDVIERRAFDAISLKYWNSGDYYSATGWHDCSLRAYLNSTETVRRYQQPDGSTSKKDFSTNGFLSRFSSEELERICPPGEDGIPFTAEDNSSEGYTSCSMAAIDPISGKATIDKVLLLSTREFKRYYSSAEKSAAEYLKWNHDNGFDVGIPDEKLLTGQYSGWFPAKFPMAEDSIACDGKRALWWWLRSPGNYGNDAAYVNIDGNLIVYGSSVNSGLGVRPALWLNL